MHADGASLSMPILKARASTGGAPGVRTISTRACDQPAHQRLLPADPTGQNGQPAREHAPPSSSAPPPALPTPPAHLSQQQHAHRAPPDARGSTGAGASTSTSTPALAGSVRTAGSAGWRELDEIGRAHV